MEGLEIDAARRLSIDDFRPKVSTCINKYLSLSEGQSLTFGLFCRGECFVFESKNGGALHLYDIGSISKTMTAHLILKLRSEKRIDLSLGADKYLDLPEGDYPSVYELLTHTAGYGHLTPAEITIPKLLKHGYAKENIYGGCDEKTVIKALSKRRHAGRDKYSYSDFSYAILALIAQKISGRHFADLFEDFIHHELGMKNTYIEPPEGQMRPPSMRGHKEISPWRWERDNPYIAGGGIVSSVYDMLIYITRQIEGREPYIIEAHKLCERSVSDSSNIATAIGWHTYKRSNQLWHVGGVGTFRSSIILNKRRKIGVVVLGNSKGIACANVHYLAKMLYSEIKINKIELQKEEL